VPRHSEFEWRSQKSIRHLLSMSTSGAMYSGVPHSVLHSDSLYAGKATRCTALTVLAGTKRWLLSGWPAESNTYAAADGRVHLHISARAMPVESQHNAAGHSQRVHEKLGAHQLVFGVPEVAQLQTNVRAVRVAHDQRILQLRIRLPCWVSHPGQVSIRTYGMGM